MKPGPGRTPAAGAAPAVAPAAIAPAGYALLDSGGGRKLERFGPWTLSRPCAQAMWRPRLPPDAWQAADAAFSRDGGLRWEGRDRLPPEWEVTIDGLRFRLAPTDFGHLGVFPEQRAQWAALDARVRTATTALGRPPAVLNLFAYSGGSTLATARAGAAVCHLDASRGMVDWARDNATRNGLAERPVRWIVDDAARFVEREARRDRRYEGIILDPPSFGRGNRGEVFKIEQHLPPLLDDLARLLPPALPADGGFVLLSCHTPELTPVGLRHLLAQALAGRPGRLEQGEMLLHGEEAAVLPVPSGAWALWTSDGP